MFEKIVLKDKIIELEDLNQLTEKQLKIIRAVSKTKTMAEWKDPNNKFPVKLKLSDNQIKHVLATKDYIVAEKRAVDLLDSELIELSPHAERRAASRIEGKDPDSKISIQTMIDIANLIINSNDIIGAEWKGYRQLSYNLKGTINKKEIILSVSFSKNLLLVTIITPNDSRKNYGFSMRDLLDDKIIEKLNEHS